MIQETDLIDEQLKRVGHQPQGETLRYFPIPPRAHGSIGKLVVSYVHIDRQGFLDANEPRIYGVTSRTNTFQGHQRTEERSPQVHVFTEDLSLRRGLFTDYGRASSEAVGVSLMPELFVPEYAQDRIAHLQALQGEVQETHGLIQTQKQKITTELAKAINFLEAKIDS